MANKRLSLQDIELMKGMVVKGVSPEDIAKHFNIAISSVHNYKNRFKADGVKFPDVRGKRPTGSVEVSTTRDLTPVKQTIATTRDTPTMETINVVVNGVSVHVNGQAKSVNISKDGIEVNF